ncbi:MAG: DinB family protein [Anaerolineae bacterium]|nr:DinB family protein [Anaerolineae bacterium]
MNALDILEHGHQMVMDTIGDLPAEAWEQPGSDQQWSAKDIVAHLASREHVLLETLYSTFCHGPAPTLDRWLRDQQTFDQAEVARRRSLTVAQILAEYEAAYYENVNLLIRIPPQELHQGGLLPWNGETATLEDFILEQAFHHKQVQSLQIARFGSQAAHMPVYGSEIRTLA